jgi:DNA repair protein RecO (recombination protein O)
MKVELTPCYILHRRDYSETSLILEVFSREFGRVNLIAKGAKRNKKQQGTSYNLYQKYHISWVAKSELGTLTDIEQVSLSPSLKPELMMTGFYMNEVMLRLLHKHESHPELFDSYDSAINKLSNEMPEQIVLRYYEKTLLQSLGYGVILDHEVETGESLNPDKEYNYKLDFGPSIDSGDSEVTGIRISGKTLLELDSETLIDEKNINEAKVLLRLILEQHLGERPLASRELYQAYIRNKKSV